jgi:stearoyl-CoA desaturase (delta-9 desaturase)
MKTKAWHRSIGALVSLPLLAFGIYLDITALIYSFAMYMIFVISVSIGYHRLFAHSAYTTRRLWHWLFGILGSISLTSSPVQWSIVHLAHHRFSDTEQDPHITNWRYFFRFKDRSNLSADRKSIKLMRDPMHKFFIKYSFSLSAVFALSLLVSSGVWGFLFLYAIPVSMFLLINGLHTIYAHGKTGPLDRPYFEFIFPLAGEWLHSHHHKNSQITRSPNGLDLGGIFIELIRTDKA